MTQMEELQRKLLFLTPILESYSNEENDYWVEFELFKSLKTTAILHFSLFFDLFMTHQWFLSSLFMLYKPN